MFKMSRDSPPWDSQYDMVWMIFFLNFAGENFVVCFLVVKELKLFTPMPLTNCTCTCISVSYKLKTEGRVYISIYIVFSSKYLYSLSKELSIHSRNVGSIVILNCMSPFIILEMSGVGALTTIFFRIFCFRFFFFF